MALDYSRASSAKTAAQNAADAAALAVAQMSDKSDAEMAAFARTVYDTNMTGVSDTSGLTFTAVRKPEGVQVTANFQNKNYISSVVGGNTNAVNVTSLAGYAGNSTKYIDVYVLADNSASMAIGATDADILKTYNATGCALACHANGSDVVAKNAGATLRFDVMKSALSKIINDIKNSGSPNVFRFGVYSFAQFMNTEINITSNLTGVDIAIGNMQMAGTYAGTNLATNLNSLKAKILTSTGDGSSPLTPIVYVILITDAINDSTQNNPDGSLTSDSSYVPYAPNAVPDPVLSSYTDVSGLNPNWCQPLKDIGVNFITMELEYLFPKPPTYVDMYNQMIFTYIENTLKPLTKANMRACASNPSLALSANTPADVQAASLQIIDIISKTTPTKLRIFK
jgi:hypothetical protein